MPASGLKADAGSSRASNVIRILQQLPRSSSFTAADLSTKPALFFDYKQQDDTLFSAGKPPGFFLNCLALFFLLLLCTITAVLTFGCLWLRFSSLNIHDRNTIMMIVALCMVASTLALYFALQFTTERSRKDSDASADESVGGTGLPSTPVLPNRAQGKLDQVRSQLKTASRSARQRFRPRSSASTVSSANDPSI